MITLTNLSKAYKHLTAVSPLDLYIPRGQCLALIGHNGAGKSTLIKMMLGLIVPTTGEVKLNNQAPTAASVREKIGYLPEIVSLYPTLSGKETLDYFAKLKKHTTKHNTALLEQVGIADAANQRVGTYSKGMRQRLALAQALIGNPDILFLDEPTTGLDPASRQQFYQLISELREKGVSIILCSHALAEIALQVDRIIIMKQGHKIADGDLSKLRSDAELPTKLTVRSQEKLPESWQKQGENQWSRTISQAEKIPVMKALLANHHIDDIEISPPTLDELYTQYLKRNPT